MTQPGLVQHLVVEPRGAAFAQARFLSDRKAFGRYLREQQVDAADQGAKEEARRAFEQLAPLRDPDVRSLAVEALTQARGAPVVSTAWTAWTTVYRPTGGWRQEASWSSYCSWHGEQATQVHIRGEGVVFAPVVTTDGYRKNSSVATVYQLVADCDANGEWEPLLSELDRLGMAFLAHQSDSAAQQAFPDRISGRCRTLEGGILSRQDRLGLHRLARWRRIRPLDGRTQPSMVPGIHTRCLGSIAKGPLPRRLDPRH
jgi:hypothetical protein